MGVENSSVGMNILLARFFNVCEPDPSKVVVSTRLEANLVTRIDAAAKVLGHSRASLVALLLEGALNDMDEALILPEQEGRAIVQAAMDRGAARGPSEEEIDFYTNASASAELVEAA